jgi:hypothetical protein
LNGKKSRLQQVLPQLGLGLNSTGACPRWMVVDSMRRSGATAGLNTGANLGYIRVGTVADWAKWAVREERVIGLLGENGPCRKKRKEAG